MPRAASAAGGDCASAAAPAAPAITTSRRANLPRPLDPRRMLVGSPMIGLLVAALPVPRRLDNARGWPVNRRLDGATRSPPPRGSR